MQNWEYETLPIPGNLTGKEDVARVLNVQGSFGWELVSVVREEHGYLCFLKRPSDKDYHAVMEGSSQEVPKTR